MVGSTQVPTRVPRRRVRMSTRGATRAPTPVEVRTRGVSAHSESPSKSLATRQEREALKDLLRGRAHDLHDQTPEPWDVNLGAMLVHRTNDVLGDAVGLPEQGVLGM